MKKFSRPISVLFVLFLFGCSTTEEIERYRLNTRIEPMEGGLVSPASGTFESGETFTITATAAENYTFSNWSGDANGTSNTVSVTMDSDKDITASFVKRDSDGDGVSDDIDDCADTQPGDEVDSNGCADRQKDTDGDGISDHIDSCPNSPSSEEVDDNGCSDSQKDTDGDGVSDDLDICPNTSIGETVDDNGCSGNQIPNYLPLNGLAAYYPFNGNSNDLSGNENNGIVKGSSLSNDRFNNPNAAFSFDGIDDYIEVPDDVTLRPQYISISVWFKTNSGLIQSLVYKTDLNTALNEQYSLALNFNGSNRFDCSVKNGNNCERKGIGWQRNQVTQVVNDNIWHHLVYTYDGVQSVIYIDGVNISARTFASGVIDNCPGSPLLIGRGWSGYQFNGFIDDIAIWNRPLTSTEVANIYGSGKN